MTWHVFASVSTINSVWWDDVDNQLASQSLVPCAVAGTNALALTVNSGASPISAYGNYQDFIGVAAATNTTAVTAQVGGLAVLNVYKDTAAGPVALTGGEIFAGNLFILTYDSALNSGSGGFHLMTGPGSLVGAYLPLSGGTLTGTLNGTSISLSGVFRGTSIVGSGNATVASLNVGGNASLAALIVGGGSSITRVLSTLSSIAFTSLTPSGTQDQTISLVGCSINDVVMVGPPSASAGLVFFGFVSAASVVTVRAANVTALTTITPASGNYKVTAMGLLP